MWKTRFEVNTNNNNDLTRHRTLASSSAIIHHYYSRPSPTVPRVREDSPSAVVRSSPPSSIPNLAMLPEEDEETPYSNLLNNEQPSLVSITLRKQNSYQTINKHQIVLPTIVESNDHDVMIDSMSNKANENMISSESIDDRHDAYVIKLKPEDSFVATNTNYNQVMNVNIERKERKLNPNKHNQMTGLTLDKRINELLQQRKSTSSSTDIGKNEILIPTTFKDISAFFENKALVASTANTSEQKKMVRAKRSLSLNRYIPINKNELPKVEIISSTEEESTIFHRQIKRIKKTHKSEYDSLNESESIVNHSIAERSTNFNHSIRANEHKNRSKQLPIMMNKITPKKTLSKQWFILLLFTNIVFVCFYLLNLTKSYKNPFVHLQTYPSYFFPQQSKEPIHLINNNSLFQYGQFIRNRFFSLLDLSVTFIGQIFFRIDKYQYKNNIVYVATSTYEQIYDWFIHLFK